MICAFEFQNNQSIDTSEVEIFSICLKHVENLLMPWKCCQDQAWKWVEQVFERKVVLRRRLSSYYGSSGFFQGTPPQINWYHIPAGGCGADNEVKILNRSNVFENNSILQEFQHFY